MEPSGVSRTMVMATECSCVGPGVHLWRVFLVPMAAHLYASSESWEMIPVLEGRGRRVRSLRPALVHSHQGNSKMVLSRPNLLLTRQHESPCWGKSAESGNLTDGEPPRMFPDLHH